MIQYIADQFKAGGVQPGGDIENGNRSWFQKVPLLESQISGTPEISLNENGTLDAGFNGGIVSNATAGRDAGCRCAKRR